MATVYLAEDLKHQRRVALKVLRPEVAYSLGAERFLREIVITAGLQHPNILPLYDSGKTPDTAGGQVYYVMPFVEGESLRDRLAREKQLPVEEALRLTREIAEALGYAHGEGIIHRDIKPENILLLRGHAVVADFGIARAVSMAGGEKMTQTGLSVGTPLYMSPEQAAGDADLDGRSDLYSLGLVLYELLVGEPPFTGPTPQVIAAKRVTQPVPSARQFRESVPPRVDQLLQRLLARAPADRVQSAAELVAELPSPTRPGSPRRPPARWPAPRAAPADSPSPSACSSWPGCWPAAGSSGSAREAGPGSTPPRSPCSRSASPPRTTRSTTSARGSWTSSP